MFVIGKGMKEKAFLFCIPMFCLCLCCAALPGAPSQALFLLVSSSQCSGSRMQPQTPHSSAQRSAVLLGAAAQGCVLGLDVAVLEHVVGWCCSGAQQLLVGHPGKHQEKHNKGLY